MVMMEIMEIMEIMEQAPSPEWSANGLCSEVEFTH
jgi:hypothetical protein